MPLITEEPTCLYRFNNPEQNKEDTRLFLAKGVFPFNLPKFVRPENVKLVRAPNCSKEGVNGQIEHRLIIDKEGEPVTVYRTRLKADPCIVYPHKGMIETETWCSSDPDHSDIVNDFVYHYFDYLLTANIIVSDTQLSAQSVKRQVDLLSWVIENGGFVYIADSSPDQHHAFGGLYTRQRINTTDELMSTYYPLLFGTDISQHLYRHAVMSRRALR